MVFADLRKKKLIKKDNNYIPKCWKVLFPEPGFIEIFFRLSEVRASAEIVEMNRGLEIVRSNT